LDEVPQVALAARVSAQWTLVARDGSYVSVPPSGAEVVLVPASPNNPSAILGGVNLGANRWALRGAGGLFLSPRRGGEVFADALAPGVRETLTVEPRGGGRVALRTVDGSYLARSRDTSALLRAEAPSHADLEAFRIITWLM
jgi:hypothetical protein